MVSHDSANLLPSGWTECSVRDVTIPVSKINTKHGPNRQIDYIDISSIDNIRHVVGSAKQYRLKDAPSRARQIVRAGDVLFATVRPYLRNIARVPKNYDQQIASTGFSVLRPVNGIYSAFLFYKAISRDFVNTLSGIQYGVSYPAVKDDQVREQTLWLPPTEEQHRIVAKVEELFSELDKGVESLKTARAQLNTYRQAVLKHAFEGKLTADWREENKDKLETPEQLLARIKHEREARYEAQLQEWKTAVKEWGEGGKNGKKPARPRKQLEIDYTSDNLSKNLPELPKGWGWVKISALLNQPLANGHSVKDRANGFPVLRLTALKAEKLDLTEAKYGDWERGDALPYLVQQGDFLISRGNGSKNLVGRGGLVGTITKDVGYPDTMIRLRINPRTVNDYFFSLVWNSYLLRQQIEATARTTAGIYKINQRHILNFEVPLCSLGEQEIVAKRLSASLSAIDAVETEIENQLLKSKALRQSILMKAFSGQLVAQDPSDEPASVLLDRISAEKERDAKDGETTKKTRKKRKAAA